MTVELHFWLKFSQRIQPKIDSARKKMRVCCFHFSCNVSVQFLQRSNVQRSESAPRHHESTIKSPLKPDENYGNNVLRGPPICHEAPASRTAGEIISSLHDMIWIDKRMTNWAPPLHLTPLLDHNGGTFIISQSPFHHDSVSYIIMTGNISKCL